MYKLQKYLNQIRIPGAYQQVYKDECVYSYDNPRTSTGLYVSLTSFLGFGKAYVDKYAAKTGYMVYLHMREVKIQLEGADDDSDAGKAIQDDKDGVSNCKITRLAIGIEGGYTDANDSKKFAYKHVYNVVVMPDFDEIAYPNEELPLVVQQSIAALLAQDSNIIKLDKEMLTGTWDGEIRMNSKYSDDLKQLNNGKKIPPSNWKCEECDLTSNLWLNLTDGAILCGRKFFDGSGGNDHAVQHYQKFGYPLAVKLGTIGSGGKADVFSYAEDEMVIDTKLEEHLKHFGINMSAMKKSEKSMVELELEINQRIGEWSLLTESSGDLLPLSGPGCTGIRNLGNSCYISSVMQVLFHINDFKVRYVGKGADYYFAKFPEDPANDFNIQMAKLGNGLWSGKYSMPSSNAMDSDSANGISPAMFKYVVGRNHVDFGSKQQQDAYDFLLHLITLLQRNSLNEPNPMDALKFAIEERVECGDSKKVRYGRRDEYCLPLQLPLEKATNLEEIEEYKAKEAKGLKGDKQEPIRYRIPLQVCLERFFSTEHIDIFFSPATKRLTSAKKTSRLVNMPDYLMMHLRKFTLGDDWVPKKLDVSIEMPDIIDLSEWRAGGLQPGEEELPDVDVTGGTAFSFDMNVIDNLMQMGFPQEACKRAAFHTKNGGVEVATNWIMEHIGDPDLSHPFIVPDVIGNDNKNKNSVIYVPNPESLSLLVIMGFQERHAIKALKATGGNVERATDWIFTHAGELDNEDMDTATCSGHRNLLSYRDGAGKYKLMAFISHMGTSAQVGHYVCHILKDGQWVIFNDNKVAVSQKPPKDLGYLYLYKREE